MSRVKHGKRFYKQMSLEVAVRNPERYEDILMTFVKFEGIILDEDGILDVYSQLYLDGVITSDSLSDICLTKEFLVSWIKENCSHNNEWGYPTGYQAAFTRYLKTLSEFGFIYAQYQQKLLLSPIAKAIVSKRITLSEAFALQSMRFWRKSPYRRVLNDFNFFEFIIDSLIVLREKGHRLSYTQFLVSLFSDNGNVEEFLQFLEENKIGSNLDEVYTLVKSKYDRIDSDHAKIAQINSAFRDYGNTVFRVLQLTGFITIDYRGIILISVNENRMHFYQALKKQKFFIPESAKENEKEYFNFLGAFDVSLEKLVVSFRGKEDYSTIEYNKKISQIIKSYNLNCELIERLLLKVSSGIKKGEDPFWFMQDPVKFEFLLTLLIYSYYGDTFIYKPNYICDELGIPYSHAPGNIGDIEIYDESNYWLIEATLIRSKLQQINNETVNLFRHVDDTKKCSKYLTLVAPYIHEDTKLIFDVASVITLLNRGELSLNSVAQTTLEFVENLKKEQYFSLLKASSNQFIIQLKDKLNSIALS